MYAYRVRFHIGASLAALPALHALVFTGGIGEHDARLRAAVCGPLEHLGIALDPHANAAANGTDAVDVGAGKVPILVIPTDEEQQIARYTIELVTQSPTKGMT
jgi:acetate kinase